MEFYETVRHRDDPPLPAFLQSVRAHTDALPSCIQAEVL